MIECRYQIFDKFKEDKKMKKAKSLLALILATLIAFGSFVCAWAVEDPSESEENGTTATADVFGIGSAIKAKLSDTTDIDYFAFTAADSGLVTVTLKHDKKTGVDPNATYFTVTVFDSTGLNEIDSFKSKGADDSKSIDFSVTPGSYYVLVEGGSVLDTTLEYVLSATINKTALFEKEPNNIASQATELKASKKGDAKNYYGAITADDGRDVDYYEVKFTKETLVSFGIYNTASKTGNYKASFVKIVDGEYGKPLEKVAGSITINDGETLKDSPNFGVDKGTYYLKVEGIGDSTGGYQVRVFDFDSNSSVALEHEFNNEARYAQEIKAGNTVTANIFDESDIDIFVLEVPQSNYGYEITLADNNTTREVTNGQWTLEITDENGHVVEDKVNVLNSEPVTAETAVLEKGLYYINVTAGNVFTGETYKVTVKAKTAPVDDGEDDKDDDGITSISEFFEQIKNIDWSNFMKNFEGWFEYINVIGIVTDIIPGIVKMLSDLVFSKA